jgi:hypothetical protein
MVDAEDGRCKKIIDDYSDYIIYHKNSNYQNAPQGILTPTKVCLHTNITYIGEMSENALGKFFESCRKGVIW